MAELQKLSIPHGWKIMWNELPETDPEVRSGEMVDAFLPARTEPDNIVLWLKSEYPRISRRGYMI